MKKLRRTFFYWALKRQKVIIGNRSFSRADEKAIITRCGFSEQNSNRGYRNLFLNPDGTIFNGSGSDLRTNLLLEIHERNIEGFAKKIEWYFPPAKRI